MDSEKSIFKCGYSWQYCNRKCLDCHIVNEISYSTKTNFSDADEYTRKEERIKRIVCR